MGVTAYHFYPSKVQGVLYSISGGVDEAKEKVYSIPVKEFIPEERGSYGNHTTYGAEGN